MTVRARRFALVAAGLAPALVVGCAGIGPARPSATIVPPAAAPAEPAIRRTSATAVEDDPPPIPTTLPPVFGEPAPAEPGAAIAIDQAIAYALRHNPRLRAARAVVGQRLGREAEAFAPFLPQASISGRTGATSRSLAPGGLAGGFGILATAAERTHEFREINLQIQWRLHDFGRTLGRYDQSLSQSRMAALRFARAQETVAFDVVIAYQQARLAAALRAIQEQAIKSAESTLDDIRARRVAGAADRDDELRGLVQLAEARDGLVVAREQEQAALARLNNAMGRPAALAIAIAPGDDDEPGPVPPIEESLAIAAARRPEIGEARAAVAAARSGRDAAAADFLPIVTLLGSQGVVEGEAVRPGYLGGVGLVLEQPLYRGGARTGAVRVADAEVDEACALAQSILDNVTLEVTLAHLGIVAGRDRIELARPAVDQARENLRMVRDQYRNGDATPTDIVDAETALTRAQQRDLSARYEYREALARLEYARGDRQGSRAAPAEAARLDPPPDGG